MTASDEIGDDSLYVRFDADPAGTVHLGRRRRRPDYWTQEFPLSRQEWETLCGLVDEWRARTTSEVRFDRDGIDRQ